MKPISEQIKNKPWLGWVLFLGSLLVVFLMGLLASVIIERRTEAVFTNTPQVKFGETEPRNEIWGKNFPREYETYMQTADTTFRSKHGGSATRDVLGEDPRIVILFAGYPFSIDFKQARGHYYAVDDVVKSLRPGAPMNGEHSKLPNTCWTCKSPDVPRLIKENGIVNFYKGKWDTKGHEVVNHIGCGDCHDSKTMNLTITRPALIEAFQRQGKDITKATHQEMRSLVCAQCHVEYYFDKTKVEDVAYLTFPWDKGTTVEDMERYYDTINFSDWTHALSKTPMIKAQHPDYEIFQTGVHAKKGLACADCHMPYRSEGGQKFTDHHIQSPLNNVANSCQVCHRDETESLVKLVYERQDKVKENRDKLEELLVRAHVEAKTAWDKGATEQQMQPVLKLIRQAQWRWDFAAAGHGNSFHSPLETMRIIAGGIAKAQDARVVLARILGKLGVEEVAYPDITTKEKAQKYIGLDMQKLNADKQKFMNTIVPQWKVEAKKREATYKVKEL